MAADGQPQRAVPAGLDTTVAHPARVYDYWLGGKDNFAADREAAERVLAATPGLRMRVRANRAFLARVVRFLAGEAGIRQFLDIGTGIPTANNTHEVAQEVARDARIVYVDNDPIVLTHARALLTSTPEGATDYLEADATTSGCPRRRRCAGGTTWPASSRDWNWSSPGLCRSISGGRIQATSHRRAPRPRTVGWRARVRPRRHGAGARRRGTARAHVSERR